MSIEVKEHEHKVNDWSSKTYSTNASFVYSEAFTSPVLALLEPINPNSSILDLGCGSGELSIQISKKLNSDGRVVGTDISSDMIRRAKELELLEVERHDKGKLEWKVIGGENINQVGEELFDSVFSNAAIHWMKKDPYLVIQNVHSILKFGGKFAGEFGGYLNMIGVRSALHSTLKSRGHDAKAFDPWFFPSPAHYSELLVKAGFRVESCLLVPRVTPLPTGLRGWLNTFGFSFFEPLTEIEKEEVIKEVCEKLEVDMVNEKGEWEVMYVRLRFVAIKI